MIALITRWTTKPNDGDVPPTKRATRGRAPVASMTRLKSSPPAKLAAAPHPSEYKVLAPGPSGSRLIGSEGPGARTLYSLGDRKSTRLNSSHGYISYAVFCLKKKKKQIA